MVRSRLTPPWPVWRRLLLCRRRPHGSPSATGERQERARTAHTYRAAAALRPSRQTHASARVMAKRRMRTHSAERPVAPSWGRECVRVRCTRFGESPPPPPPERALSARLQGKPGVRVLRLFFSLSLGHPRLTTRSPFSGPLPSHMTPAPCVTGGGDTVRPYSCGLACAPVRSHAGHVSGRVAVFD